MSTKYYDAKKLLSKNAKYYMVFGERSNGKTYQFLLEGLKEHVKHGNQMGILRRWREDFQNKRAAKYFDNLICNGKGENKVKELTGGKYDTVIYDSSRWYLAYYDHDEEKYIKEPEPLAYAFALSEMEHEKGNSYPKITIIFLDEFMTKGRYLVDEFVLFMNVCSTIIRDRTNVRIFMAANTISKYCPYFNEMGLNHIKQMKKGDIDIYNYGDSGLTVAVEYSDSPNKLGKPSDVYFAFDNPKLKMITSGEWELDIYPHLQYKYDQKDVIFRYFIMFDNNILEAEIVITDNQAFTFIHKKTTPIKHENQDIIFTTDANQNVNYLGKLTKPINKVGRKIYYFFSANKVFYSSNDVGEIMNHYLLWCNKVA